MSSKLIVCLLTLLLKWGDVTMGGMRGQVPCPIIIPAQETNLSPTL